MVGREGGAAGTARTPSATRPAHIPDGGDSEWVKLVQLLQIQRHRNATCKRGESPPGVPSPGGPCGVPPPQAARPTCFGVDAERALQQMPDAFADVDVEAGEAVLQHDLPVRVAPPSPHRPLGGQAGQGAAGQAAAPSPPPGAAPRSRTRVRSILLFSSSQRCTESRFLGNSPCSASRCCGQWSRPIADTAGPAPPAQTLPPDLAQHPEGPLWEGYPPGRGPAPSPSSPGCPGCPGPPVRTPQSISPPR